jgi:hypothetical protein
MAEEIPAEVPVLPVQTTLAVKPKRARKPGRPRKKAFKLSKFDKFLLSSVRSGESDSESLRAKHNLDPLQFETRLKALAERGYIVPDAANPRVLRLGIAAFDHFPQKKAEPKPKVEVPSLPAEPAPAPAALAAPAPVAPLPHTIQVPLPQSLEKASAEPDLNELLSRGKPNPNYKKTFMTISAVGRKWLEEQGQQKPVKETLILEVPHKNGEKRPVEAKPSSGSEEHCELCRASFKLSVGKDSNPKYGNCFCGAPYHKDCYDSLLGSTGAQCVRCGKRLSLILDKVSEEAVKELEKLFD